MPTPADEAAPTRWRRQKQFTAAVHLQNAHMPAVSLTLPKDRELFAFIFARFIDGELTGIAEGRAMQYAPDLKSADFLARQIRDEIRHARLYKGLLAYVSPERPSPRQSWLLKQVTTPVSGRLWIEHCFLDKAVGERWVHYLMQMLIANTKDARIVKTLRAIARDEVTHIAFGEAQVKTSLAANRFMAAYLWGLYLRVDYALALVHRLTRALVRRRYSIEATELLDMFFRDYRELALQEVAGLLGVPPQRSIWRLLKSQIIYWARWPFVGWRQNPERAFRAS
ncbi:hypothetical protein Turpa_3721 [Turneriella parva DSM 21527]|uniref:Ferritin-like domain-containing protein n=2 Tax=Turneriella TaxID=338321 RepID=I4BAP8_TURPD|nr:hypothetical protein Turpa_3721 [Turneriella parva DSM 21527]